MIFRKPYAMLIRNFKLVHGILLFLMIMFSISLNKTYEFLNNYIDQALYQQVIGAISENFSFFTYILYILIIAIFTTIIVLLNNKKKPIRSYLIANIFYIATIVPIIIGIVALNSIQMNSISIQFLGIAKDLLMIAVYGQIPFIIMVLGRTVGFNVKQFNFQKDLNELAIEESDNAEFEVGVELDAVDFKTKLNKQFRMMKYVFLENKLLFTIGAAILVFAIIVSSYVYFGVIKKIYHENESFRTGGLTVKVVDTHQSKVLSNGTELFKNDFFVAVTLSIKNRSGLELGVPYENIYLRTDSLTRYEPYARHRFELAEFGKRISKTTKLKPGESGEYVLIYKVADKYRKISKRLEYLDSIEDKGNETKYKYVKVQLNSKEVPEAKIDSTKKLGETLSLSGSLLKNTSIQVISFDMADRYYPEYVVIDPYTKKEQSYNTIVSPVHTNYKSKIVGRVKININADKSIDQKAVESFFERYGRLTYQIKDKKIKHAEALYNIEPSMTNGYAYFEIDSEVRGAEKIYIDFVIRDKAYRYNLK